MSKKAKFNETPQGTLQKSHDKSWFTNFPITLVNEDEIVLQIMKGDPDYLEVVKKKDFEGIDNSN